MGASRLRSDVLIEACARIRITYTFADAADIHAGDDRTALILFFAGGLVDELVGLRWQPIGGGNSVANLGMTRGMLASALLHGRPIHRLLAVDGIVLGGALLAERNIHGAALLAGMVAGIGLMRVATESVRDRTIETRSTSARP